MKQALTAGASGLLFGAGLAISGMMNPACVLGFLDLFGVWDPSLAFVMASALAVNAPLVWLLRARQRRPAFATRFEPPKKTQIDAPLLLGSAYFGVGWGLAGYCPGPALAALPQGGWALLSFVLAMLIGMMLAHKLQARLRL
jgi:hypothetical protein